MEVDLNFCKKLPKVELHAHLGGSLSGKTLQKLLVNKKVLNKDAAEVMIGKEDKRTMAECFEMFRLLHEIVDDAETIKQVTKDVIHDFAADGVLYLELRSTPRDNHSTGLMKRSYIESVLAGIKEYEYENLHQKNPIVVKLLPSFDRGQNVKNCFETLKLAEEFKLSTEKIVGIDFSGNPHKGNVEDFLAPLQLARKSGFKLSIHAAEVPGCLKDNLKLMAALPDRIGHGTYIEEDKSFVEYVFENQIPLEICMSSNIKTQTSPADHCKHHLTTWSKWQHPCLISTDDKGIFSTSLSQEYMLAASALKYSQPQLFELACESVEHVFADKNTKQSLRQTFHEAKHSLLQY